MKKRIIAFILICSFVFSNVQVVTEAEGNGIEIATQPSDCYASVNETAQFTVDALGENITYNWYYSKDGGQSFTRCFYQGYRTNVLSFSVLPYHYNILFYCVISDKNGNSVQTNTVRVYPPLLDFINQPKDGNYEVGETAVFSAEADGYNVSYLWYYSKDGGNTWSRCFYSGYRTNTLSFETKAYQYNYLFKCEAKDKFGNVIESSQAALMPKELTIIKQPENSYAAIGNTAKFSIEADGYSVKYLWYYSKDNGNTWSRCFYSGYRTNTLSFETKDYQFSYKFRCEVTDRQGNKIESNPVSLLREPLRIISQPEDFVCYEKSPVTFSVKASRDDVSYQWFCSKDGGNTFSECLFGTAKRQQLYVSSMPLNKNGCMFYCKITDSFGNSVESKRVTLTVKAAQTAIITDNDDDFEYVQHSTKKVLISTEDFKENSVMGEKNRVSVSVNHETEATAVSLLSFKAYADVSNGTINISIPGIGFKGNYVLSVAPCYYYIPVSGGELIDEVIITFNSDEQEIYFGNFELAEFGEINVNEIRTGIYNKSQNVDRQTFTTDMGFSEGAIDIASDGEHLYSVLKGTLCIYSLDNKENPELISELDELGNTRDIELLADKNILAVSSRENGVFFVDISDVLNPYVISNIDILELATGITIYDDYCFVATRNFGVEIYDISDIENPTFCSQVSANEEFYDCCISDGYLFVSVWAQKKVRVYDLSDIYNPQEISSIALSGAGGGCVVSDGFLYVATGYHSADRRKAVTDPGYGMGNGMEIIDVSNPYKPKKITQTRIDGRYYYSGFDHWRVNVVDGYAYITNSYNGGSIYDVTNPYAPKKVMSAVVSIPSTSPEYVKMNSSASYVFPFDPTEYAQGIFTNSAVIDEYVYFATSANGIYGYPFENAGFCEKQSGVLSGTEFSHTSTDVSIPGYTVEQYFFDGNCYSITEHNDLYYCAMGKEGIMVLDKDMNHVFTHKTKGIVKDIKFIDEYLYSAESEEGMGVYILGDNELIEKCHLKYNYYAASISYLNVFPDKKHIALQAGWTKFVVVNVEERENPKPVLTETTSTMYYRNLASGIVTGEYLCRFDRNYIAWYGCDDEGIYQYSKMKNIFNSETSGTTYIDEYALVTYNNGYVYYEPATADASTLASLETITIDDVLLIGKPYACGNLLVLSYSFGKQVTLVDISDLDAPELIAQFDVNGNPDVAYGSENDIVIPLRHGGILRITKQ